MGSIPFKPFYYAPLNLHKIMEEHGCGHSTDLGVMHGLLSLVQFNTTGDTCVVSHKALADRCFFNEKTIRRSIERLKDAGLIIQHKKGTCFWYHITFFDSDFKSDNESDNSDSLSVNSDSLSVNSDFKSDSLESFQEFKQDIPTSPILGNVTSNGNHTEEKAGAGGDSKYLLKPEDPLHIEPVSTEVTEEKPKTSLKGIDDSFLLSSTLSLADHFAGDDKDYVLPKHRQKQSNEFRPHLIQLFESPPAVRHFPDLKERLSACTDVLYRWIDIVKSQRKPARHVNWINYEPGRRALIRAMKQVFGSHADEQEIDADPVVVQMWKDQYGDNWKEKRAKMRGDNNGTE